MWFRTADDQPEGEQEETDGESPNTRDERYPNSTMDAVSNPDHSAVLHYGHLAWDDYDRMLAFSQTNQVRLNLAINVLWERRDAAEASGNWYEAAQIQQAIAEVE